MAKSDPNPFTTRQALAEFEHDVAETASILDAVVAQHREHAADGATGALATTYLGLQLVPPPRLAGLLAIAVSRLAGAGDAPPDAGA